jgi:hypothetical protein
MNSDFIFYIIIYYNHVNEISYYLKLFNCIKKLFGSQPEDGFMKKVETCRYYDFLIIS